MIRRKSRTKIWILILGPKDTGKTSFLVQFANIVSYALKKLEISVQGKLRLSPTETTTVDNDLLVWKLSETNINFLATGGGYLSEIVRNRNESIQKTFRLGTNEQYIMPVFILGDSIVTKPSTEVKNALRVISELLIKFGKHYDFQINKIPLLAVINKADLYLLKENLIDKDFLNTMFRRLNEINDQLFERRANFKIIKGYSKIGGIEKVYLINESPELSFNKLLEKKSNLLSKLSSMETKLVPSEVLNGLIEELNNEKLADLAVSTITDFLEFINQSLHINKIDKETINKVIKSIRTHKSDFFKYLGL